MLWAPQGDDVVTAVDDVETGTVVDAGVGAAVAPGCGVEVQLIPSVVTAAAGPLANWPTATQSVAPGHETPATAWSPAGAAAVLQVDPPSALVRYVAWVLPVALGPALMQVVALAQATCHTAAEPAGKASRCHVSPPSVVTTATAGSDGREAPPGLGPTAMQCDGEEQAIVRRARVPPSTVRGIHVVPPSSVSRMVAPTAMHWVAETQATEARPGEEDGIAAAVHVAPSSLETTMRPDVASVGSGANPVAIHKPPGVQVTPRRLVFVIGTAGDVHVSPPSVVATTVSSPTATHSSTVVHDTASSSGVLEGRVSNRQVCPPSKLTPEVPLPVPSPPTATHMEVVGQLTASKAARLGAAPPGVGIAARGSEVAVVPGPPPLLPIGLRLPTVPLLDPAADRARATAAHRTPMQMVLPSILRRLV